MKHIHDDELRAYARKNLLHRTHDSDDAEMRVMAEHLALCSHCRERHASNTFADTEDVLRSYMHATTTYPSIAAQVMRKAQGQQMLPKKQAKPLLGWRFVSIPSGLVLVGVFLVIVTLIAVANIPHKGGNGTPVINTKSQRTSNTVIPTLAAQTGAPFISICHQPKEVALKRLYICGYNFTPGSSVELIISLPDAATTIHKIVMIDKNGTLQYALSVTSCKYVPATITALSGNDKVEFPTNQQAIQFGTCPPVSGVVGTPEQRASWLLPTLKSEYRKEK